MTVLTHRLSHHSNILCSFDFVCNESGCVCVCFHFCFRVDSACSYWIIWSGQYWIWRHRLAALILFVPMQQRKVSKFGFQPILRAPIVHCDFCVKPTNGQTVTDFGHVLISISRIVRQFPDYNRIAWQIVVTLLQLSSVSFSCFVCFCVNAVCWCDLHTRSKGKEFRETCSGHGKNIAGRCKCDKRYYGQRCQYVDECLNDDDCGAQGKCIDLHGTSLPKRQCYCNFGWFGPNCAKSMWFFPYFLFYLHYKCHLFATCVWFVISNKAISNRESILAHIMTLITTMR